VARCSSPVSFVVGPFAAPASLATGWTDCLCAARSSARSASSMSGPPGACPVMMKRRCSPNWPRRRDGTIAYKLVGPITPENIETVLKAEIEKALKSGS